MKLPNYDINSTVSKTNNMPIQNCLHAKFFLWGYDHYTDDEYLLGETTDKRIAKKWISLIHKDHDYRIVVEYPGSYYTTARELCRTDEVAKPKAPFCFEVKDDLPF